MIGLHVYKNSTTLVSSVGRLALTPTQWLADIITEALPYLEIRKASFHHDGQ